MCVSFPSHRNISCRNRPNECVINPIVIRAEALSIRIMKLLSFAAFIHGKNISLAVLIMMFCNKLKQIAQSRKGKFLEPWKRWLMYQLRRRCLLHPYNFRISKPPQECMLPWDYERNQSEDWSICGITFPPWTIVSKSIWTNYAAPICSTLLNTDKYYNCGYLSILFIRVS